MIIEDESGLNLEFFFHIVNILVKQPRNSDKIQTFLETYCGIENYGAHETCFSIHHH
jgi:hypothetical protein